jgi:hypothetical protein
MSTYLSVRKEMFMNKVRILLCSLLIAIGMFSVAYAQNPSTSISFILQNPLSQKVTLAVPPSAVTNYTLTVPPTVGSQGSMLYQSNASGQLNWLSPGADGSLMTLSSGVPAWSSPVSLLGSTFVQYGNAAAQGLATTRGNYLFNVGYSAGANDANASGAVISSTGGATNRSAAGLAVTATATGTGTATGINVCATGGANNYAAVFPCGTVGIGTSTPTSSALLEMSSTSQGMLTPRMTEANRDAITSPATGLLIYQTDENPGFYYYNGSEWVSLTASSGGIGSELFIRKPSDQTVSQAGNGTTSANDADLVFTVGANETWEFEVVAYLSADNDAAGLVGINALSSGGINLSTAASKAAFIAENLNASLLGIIGVGIEGDRFQNASAAGNHMKSLLTVNLAIGGSSVTNTYVKMKGFVKAGASSTTVNVRWSENISLGIGTATSVLTVQENSYLKATRVE